VAETPGTSPGRWWRAGSGPSWCASIRGPLDPSFAGRAFDEAVLADLPEGVDPCGENGEFHTFVWDAPMYREPISCRTGEVVTRDGFVYCDVVAGPGPMS